MNVKTHKADPKGVLEGTYFMDGNHAIAEGALAAGCRFFGAYPITPSTEVAERFCERAPYAGGAFVQMEDELAAIGTLIGAAWAGRKAMTVTSGPGMSLMLENLGLATMMELPMVIANVQRGGPSTGLPTLVAQQDMMQARWGGHGDYELIAVCPDSPQEAFHLTVTAFNLSETYRVPVIILTDECVGHMHEKVVIPPADEIEVVERKWYEGPKEDYLPYKNDEDGIPFMVKAGDGYRFHSTGLTHDERGYPQINVPTQVRQIDQLCGKILNNEEKIVLLEEEQCEDADVIVISYGITSRVATKSTQDARDLGLKVGYLRLITIWPFPIKRISELSKRIKGFVFPEINMGQVVTEAERVVAGECKVVRVTHCGGGVHDPEDILAAIKEAAK
jgi:2-oxoglutarate ferredoxin oxidoreductase subunit alpha